MIAPLQNWLLQQKRCVGCGMPLVQGSKAISKEREFITCKCKRIYTYDADQKSYRRALLNEI